MVSVDLAGIGIWSDRYTDWAQFCDAVRGETFEPEAKLQPELIAARERRRAPLFVKMAVEVMDQACRMAEVDPTSVATVFASGMSDMQITDYMCRTLATMPATVSPTKFHNSVHNASTGYWSIATGSHRPANAVSGYDHSGAVALLEGAAQSVDEGVPVLVTVQEMAAPVPFRSVYDSEQAFAAALLLVPAGHAGSPVSRLAIDVDAPGDAADLPAIPASVDIDGNFSRELLGVLLAAANGASTRIRLALPGSSTLAITVDTGQ